MLIKKGINVLIRTHTAGVHFGTFEERTGQEVLLSNARRIWSWSGALSLSEISKTGLNISASKISESVEEILLLQAVEIIPINKNSNITTLCAQ